MSKKITFVREKSPNSRSVNRFFGMKTAGVGKTVINQKVIEITINIFPLRKKAKLVK